MCAWLKFCYLWIKLFYTHIEQAKKAVDIELMPKQTEATPAEKQKSIVAIDLKIAEEKQKMKASEQLFANGKSILEKSLTSTKVKKDDLLRANALFSIAIENSKVASEKLEQLLDKKNSIEKTSKNKNNARKSNITNEKTSSHSNNTKKSNTTKQITSSHSNNSRKSNTTKQITSSHSNNSRKSNTKKT